MTPAPTTSSLPGTLSNMSAPVEDTMRFSSMAMPLRRATSEPVAITIALVSIVVTAPSAAFTSILPGATMRPTPI